MMLSLHAKLNQLKRFVLKRDLVLALVVAICIITLGVFMGWENNKVVLPNPAASAHYNMEPNNPLSFMSNWDGPDYLNIAQNGYSAFGKTNFFPVYPLAIKTVHRVISSPLISALLISWTSLIGAIYFYLKIVKSLFKVTKNEGALMGTLPFIFFPTAVFMLATYSEALFAFLALGAIYFALRRNYLAAALFLLPATATHITGGLVLILVMLILIEQKVDKLKIAVAGIIGSIGLFEYMFFLRVRFHDIIAFVTSQKAHGWLTHSYLDIITHVQFINAVFIILLVMAAIYWWKRRRSFSFYSLSFLLIPLVGRQYGGFNRYVLMAFPIPLMIYGYLRNKKLGYVMVIVLSTILWTYFLLQYTGGYVGG